MFLAEAKTNPATAPCFAELSPKDAPKNTQGLHIVDRGVGTAIEINFMACDVKWYQDYDDVKCHTALLRMADEYIDNLNNLMKVDLPRLGGDGFVERDIHLLGYVYMCVGEADDDIESIESNANGEYDYEWLYVTRKIEADWI